MKKNLEKITRNYNKTLDVAELENLYYSLKKAIMTQNNYEALLKERFLDKDRINTKLKQNKYEIHKIIERIIENGGCVQVNKLAIRYLENEISRKYAEIECKYKFDSRKKNKGILSKHVDIIHINKKLIEKLKFDACIS